METRLRNTGSLGTDQRLPAIISNIKCLAVLARHFVLLSYNVIMRFSYEVHIRIQHRELRHPTDK